MALAPACLILLMVGAEKLVEGCGGGGGGGGGGGAPMAVAENGRWLKVAWGPWEKELEEEEKALAALESQFLGLLLLLLEEEEEEA